MLHPEMRLLTCLQLETCGMQQLLISTKFRLSSRMQSSGRYSGEAKWCSSHLQLHGASTGLQQGFLCLIKPPLTPLKGEPGPFELLLTLLAPL